jgi:hypothetical protein
MWSVRVWPFAFTSSVTARPLLDTVSTASTLVRDVPGAAEEAAPALAALEATLVRFAVTRSSMWQEAPDSERERWEDEGGSVGPASTGSL